MLARVDELDPGMRRFGFDPFRRDDALVVHARLLELRRAGKIRP